MERLIFDPYVGQEVRVSGFPGLFRVDSVQPPNLTTVPQDWENNALSAEGGGTVVLKRISGPLAGSIIPGVRWSSLFYADEVGKVRHSIEWLKTTPEGGQYPDYIVDYEVEAKNDHAGNPSIFVLFLVEEEYFYEHGKPSQARIAALNEFAFEVQQILLELELERWTYVQTGVARRALDAVS